MRTGGRSEIFLDARTASRMHLPAAPGDDLQRQAAGIRSDEIRGWGQSDVPGAALYDAGALPGAVLQNYKRGDILLVR